MRQKLARGCCDCFWLKFYTEICNLIINCQYVRDALPVDAHKRVTLKITIILHMPLSNTHLIIQSINNV